MRSNADILMDAVHKNNHKLISIDFQEIQTISRSFAQQYIERKNNSSKQLSEKNVNKNVKKMFEVALNKRNNKPRFNFTDWEIERFPV